MDELRNFNPDSSEFKELKIAGFKASEIAGTAGEGVMAGAIATAGAYGAVGMFATAGTGAAIAGLSGAAATNATLAWLGGGTLAAGGAGVAGGVAVLGGIVAAPALLVTGFFLSDKASATYDDARSNRDEAELYDQKVRNACARLDAVKNRANQIDQLLVDLNGAFVPRVNDLANVIKSVGVDFRTYNSDAKKAVAVSAQLAQTIKIILDTSLLKEDGSLNDDSTQNALDTGRNMLAKL